MVKDSVVSGGGEHENSRVVQKESAEHSGEVKSGEEEEMSLVLALGVVRCGTFACRSPAGGASVWSRCPYGALGGEQSLCVTGAVSAPHPGEEGDVPAAMEVPTCLRPGARTDRIGGA